MASPVSGGASSEEELQAIMDQKKLKRMISNRDSARRSRKRKQKHLDDLMAEVAQLSGENGRLLASLCLAKQQRAAVEAENSVLRAQAMELRQRLRSLDEILAFFGLFSPAADHNPRGAWDFLSGMSQPIMASADNMMLYY